MRAIAIEIGGVIARALLIAAFVTIAAWIVVESSTQPPLPKCGEIAR